jgi:uncharacterized membrane protein (UPF0182 family)
VASRLLTQDRRRALFITIAVLVVVLLLSARFLASFYVDFLWHDSLGRTDVFWGVLGAKLTMFALFGGVFVLTAVINLVIADRLAPLEFSANTHPLVERFHEVFGRRMRTVRIAAATLFGLVFAVPATTQWQQWMMFRHSHTFGTADAQFGNDIGFYLFRLPFITFAVDWLFAALIIITLMVVGTHLLNGGIVVQPPRPKVRRATKAHLAVLLAVLALVKAADYWLQRYELTTADRGFVRGALYSVVNAQLPATVLLALIAVLAAGVFLSTLKTNTWRWPAVVCSLWVVIAVLGGAIYPAIVQRLVVAPNQRDKEAEFIQRNIDATRQAFGLEDIAVQPVQFGALSTDEVADDIEPLRDARLLDPQKMTDRFRVDVVERAGLAINDLDVDRFEIDGRVQQVMVGAIELDLDRVRNKSWQGLHLISTHGCGLAYAPAGQVEGNGIPVYDRTDIDQPQLYFSDSIRGYSIVGTSVVETSCPGEENASEYTGTGGVQLSSSLRRAAFALDFLDYNLIASSAVDSDSRIMWVRRVQDRVRTLAPFLHFDGDPYPVTHDERVVWIVDGYTTSDRYPYSQSADRGQLESSSGLEEPFNYIRNSVKAVVDGYDGSVRFYVMDDTDPVLRVWRSAFPDLFEPLSSMPQPLRERLRYPEELFRVQTALFSKYRLDGGQFFDGDLAWSVAQNPPEQPRGVTVADGDGQSPPTTAPSGQPADFTADVSGGRFVPYYTMFRPPGGAASERGFVLFRPFVPFSDDDSKRELQAFMTASSDPDTYGQLTAYVLPGQEEAGPLKVHASMDNDSNISKEIGLLNTPGSVVELGTMQMIPVADGVVWLRPLYLSSETAQQPTFRYVLASYNERSAFGDSVGEALSKLFSGLDVDIGDRVGNVDPGAPVDPTEPTPPPDETVEQLLADADALFAEADDALADGDLGVYQSKVDQARELVQRAVELLEAQG